MRILRRLSTWLAYLYPASLVLAVVLLRFASRRFWQAELAVYAPRVLFGLPLPLIALLLLVLKQRRLLWTQAVAAWIVLFPLMGLELPGWPRSPDDRGKTLRLLSYNANFAYGGQDALEGQVRAVGPDVAIFQQLFHSDQLAPSLARTYREVRADGEFLIASRFHIRSTRLPSRIAYDDRERSPRYIRYELETASGPLVLYSVHPISPLFQIAVAREGGLRKNILSGAYFSLRHRPDIEYDSHLRSLQVQAFLHDAARETLPVIIAGDTNLPNLSASLALFGKYQDGFSQVGSGFGYTFPSKHPWMRIDRIFADEHFRFLEFGVGSGNASDHRCVWALLEPAGSD